MAVGSSAGKVGIVFFFFFNLMSTILLIETTIMRLVWQSSFTDWIIHHLLEFLLPSTETKRKDMIDFIFFFNKR